MRCTLRLILEHEANHVHMHNTDGLGALGLGDAGSPPPLLCDNDTARKARERVHIWHGVLLHAPAQSATELRLGQGHNLACGPACS